MKISLHSLPHSIVYAMLLLLTLGSCSFPFGHEEAMSIEQRDSLIAQATALRAEGRKWRDKADFAQALRVQQEALSISQQVQDTLAIVQDYNQMGTTFRRMGRMEEALRLHYNALFYAEMFEQDTAYQWRKNLVVSLNGLGNVHLTLGNLDDALLCFRRALQGEMALGSGLGQAINYANIGAIMEQTGQLDSAQVYYDLSMQKNTEISNHKGIALCHTYFGQLNERRGQLDAAEQEYREAARLMQDNEDHWHAIEPQIALSQLLLGQGKWREAQPIIAQVAEAAGEMGSFEHLLDSERLQAECDQQRGDYRSALGHTQLARAYHDSIDSPANESVIRNICIDYEHQKAEQEKAMMRQAYESEQTLHRRTEQFGAILLFLAIVGIIILIYVYRIRTKSMDALRSVESMRTTFFTNITHEFRTPLTVILGLANQLKSPDIAQEQRVGYLDSIQQQGNSLLELVNQLLSISKLMAGFGQEEWRHGNVLDFVRMFVAGYSDYAHTRQINLNVICNEEQMEMDFVPKHIERILRNLLSNAFKFTPTGGSITLTLRRKGKYLNIDVADTGCGIATKDLPHVFELFYQGAASRKQGSSGIGLPFVKQMVQNMGGIIRIENRMPHGTLVSITLPSSRPTDLGGSKGEQAIRPWSIQDDYGQLLQSAPKALPTGENTDSDSPLVMVVEDNEAVAQYLDLLLHTSYRTIKALDGYDALHKAEVQLPDLILTDLMMPGMDGYELCRAIRQSEILGDVPIIVVSARSNDEDRIRALEAGADAYLVKPFNADELKVMADNMLSHRRQMHLRLQQSLASANAGVVTPEMRPEDLAFIERLHRVVDEQMLRGELGIDTIASIMANSKSTFNRRVKALTGISSAAYILQLRLKKACQLLQASDTRSIGEISMACGFDDMSYFSRVFKQNFGQTPTEYRQENSKADA